MQVVIQNTVVRVTMGIFFLNQQTENKITQTNLCFTDLCKSVAMHTEARFGDTPAWFVSQSTLYCAGIRWVREHAELSGNSVSLYFLV